ncbi:MAG: hypothetical protein WBA74_11570 [Cyclobacteriaceae bacterium]
MKTQSLVFFTIIILTTGCHYQAYRENSLYETALPTFPQNHEAVIYDIRDSVPSDRLMVKAIEYSLNFHPEATDTAIRDTLRSISKEVGFDVIKIRSVSDTTWDESEITLFEAILSAVAGEELSSDYITYDAKRVSFDAYKLLDNIDYADKILYAKTFHLTVKKDSLKTLFSEIYTPSGKIKTLTGKRSVNPMLKLFDLNYCLADESASWNYRMTKDNILIRKNTNHLVKIKFIQSGGQQLPAEIAIKNRVSTYDKFLMSLFYDNDDRLKSKEVLKSGKQFASVNLEYDSQGRLKKEIYDFHTTAFDYEIHYTYYTQALLMTSFEIDQ